ncbi:hemagglutinin/amebocyte aggregation factor [Plakobranchus ocellatus]|uniref:Hemagglutinin/amebocyte aggregation factor n=1 Tax=Plakobranchus ocellatus TaxID=259542 RepID=A0AAV3ZXZ5_9GAST|nr:hemagglutinin/amebocyte aggregation factor [Plakobranchus ocellatus]
MTTAVALMTTLTVALLAAGANGGYHTDWDQPFLYACHQGEILKSLYSVHNNHKEDRRWKFSCGAAPGGASPQTCYWTGYENYWDEPMSFQCPSDYVLAGLQSYHSNKREDRRFRFKCCKDSGFRTYSCGMTSYINDWDKVLDYKVPNGHVLTGVSSYHSNHREDRRYKFMICIYGKLD